MGCYRCGTRQTDPARGASPWKRGVVGDVQVLVCPDCQRGSDWTAELDRCAQCGATQLARALGETRCRACGHIGPGRRGAPPPERGAASPAESLADDVATALDRVLRRDVTE